MAYVTLGIDFAGVRSENVSMANRRDPWRAVGEQVTARLHYLGHYNQAAVARESGVSDATWRHAREGRPVNNLGKRAAICDFLGWTPDSIDSILAGGEPMLAQEGDGEDGLRPLVEALRRAERDVHQALGLALAGRIRGSLPPPSEAGRADR